MNAKYFAFTGVFEEAKMAIVTGTKNADFINLPVSSNDADYIITGNGNDIVYAYDGNDYVDGGNGDDSIHGGMGNDILYGGNGNDTLLGEGGSNFLFGGNGNDELRGDFFGAIGSDTLLGGNGNDTLNGGAGADILTGGNGSDIFEFGTYAGSRGVEVYAAEPLGGEGHRDVITDFKSGTDKIDVHLLTTTVLTPLFGLGTTYHDPIVFIGTQDFSGTQTELRFFIEGDHTVIQIDGVGLTRPITYDPDGQADTDIELTGIHHLTASDFIL
ncbi:calcium-binding protein [bacterium]|nr:MAG: calcium-binding protein [bacterium]